MADYKLVLMHRDNPVVNIMFDEKGELCKIARIIDNNLLPLPAHKDIALLKEWFQDRAVPKTRHNVKSLVPKGMTTGVYMIDNLGLSLTDCYWLKPFGSDVSWKDVNLFSNDFASAIQADIVKNPQIVPRFTKFSKYSPDASTKGDLEKKWLIDKDGKRILVKGNYGIGCQQSLNEKFVSLINKKQNCVPFVSYDTMEFSFSGEPAICCVSENFIKDDSIEFVSGYDILQSQKYAGFRSLYNQFVDGCTAIGMDSEYIKDFLSYQILLDYLVTNTDRHFNNFGIIRDSETLKPISMAPIYDSGSCLFWKRENPVITPGLFDKIKTCSFLDREDKLLRYITEFRTLDLDKLPSNEELHSIYSEGNVLPEERISFIRQCFTEKMERLERLQEKEKFKEGYDDLE